MPAKTGRVDPFELLTSILSQNIKMIEGGHFDEKNRKKPHSAEKLEGDPLVSPGIVSYAKKGKTFLVQFARPNGSI